MRHITIVGDLRVHAEASTRVGHGHNAWEIECMGQAENHGEPVISVIVKDCPNSPRML